MKVLRDLIVEARGLVQDLRLLLSALQYQRDGYVDWTGLASYMGTPVRTLRRIIPNHLRFRVTNRKVLFRIPEVDETFEYDSVRMTILKTDSHHVAQVKIEKLSDVQPPPTPATPEEQS